MADQYDAMTTTALVHLLLSDGDADRMEYWDAVCALRRRGTQEVFDAARLLCTSDCPLEQRIGCDILAQLGAFERPFASASFPLVAGVLARSDDRDCLTSAISALGFLRDLRGVDLLLPYVKSADAEIRCSVTHALTALHEDERAVAALIQLTTDADVEVRDWATCGLGSLMDLDSPAIRAAIAARLDDEDIIVRGEALVGLARRQDLRVIEPLVRALETGTYNNSVSDYASEALDELKDIDSFPQLRPWSDLVSKEM